NNVAVERRRRHLASRSSRWSRRGRRAEALARGAPARCCASLPAGQSRSQVRRRLVWGFFCQAVVLGLLSVLCSEREGRSSSRRLRSGSRNARKGSRDRNASGAWRLAALARLVFRSALTPEHAEVQGPHGGLVPAGLPGARTW